MPRILLILFIIFTLFSTAVWGQISNNPMAARDKIEKILGGSSSGKIKLLVLPFQATGITESASKSYSKIIVQNLMNTNQFEVVGPEETEFLMERENPALMGCSRTDCGVQIGKIIGANLVFGGNLKYEKEQFNLNVTLVNVINNDVEFSDQIRFNDDNADHRLHVLTKHVGEHTPMVGNIISSNNKIVVVSLGNRHGIKVGDQIVVFKSRLIPSDSEEESPKYQITNIAIIKVIRVEDNISECTYFKFVEFPQPGNFATTFIDRQKQITLVQEVRKELDTKERQSYGIESVELEPVELFDREMKNWLSQLRYYERRRDIYQTVLAAATVVTLYSLRQFNEDNIYLLIGSLGLLGYSGFEWYISRDRLNELIQEGKYKGYLNLRVIPRRDGANIALDIHF